MLVVVVAIDMVQVATDKQQVEPMLEVLDRLPNALGQIEHLLADNGYFSAANVERLRRRADRAAACRGARCSSPIALS